MRIGIIGMGYVGLPLAVAFAEAGHEVVGLDTDPGRVAALNDGRSYVEDVPDAALAPLGERLRGTSDHAELGASLHERTAGLEELVLQEHKPLLDPEDGDGLLLVYTSGTTGKPKGALLTHANCFWTNLSFDRVAGLSTEDTVLQVLPQFHVGGWNVQPLLAWWKGATVVLEPAFDPARALQLIAEKRVTTTGCCSSTPRARPGSRRAPC